MEKSADREPINAVHEPKWMEAYFFRSHKWHGRNDKYKRIDRSNIKEGDGEQRIK